MYLSAILINCPVLKKVISSSNYYTSSLSTLISNYPYYHVNHFELGIIPTVQLSTIQRVNDPNNYLLQLFQSIVDTSITPLQKLNLLTVTNDCYKFINSSSFVLHNLTPFSYNLSSVESIVNDIVHNDIFLHLFLTNTNLSRNNINSLIRSKLSSNCSKTFSVKDKIICNVNNTPASQLNGSSQVLLQNGDIFYVLKVTPNSLHIISESSLLCYYKNLKEKTSSANFDNDIIDNILVIPITIPSDKKSSFDFAFCLTIHKSQGSESSNVTIFLDDSMLNLTLLYTAITRAKSTCTLISTKSILLKCLRTSENRLDTFLPLPLTY